MSFHGGPFGAWGGRAGGRGADPRGASGLPSALSASVLLLKITTARLPSALPCLSPCPPLGRETASSLPILQFVESDADEELLFNIPFTGNVKLKGIIIMGEDDDSHPSEMRLYKNIPQMSFDDTDREPDQTFSLNRDLTGELEYATKISRFSNVYHLSIHISKNFGADTTKVLYIGLRGEWTELRRHEVTICNYEASANPADHRVHQVTPQTHFIS
ncbi:PITH domain-containing protein 1 [Crocuta crocuta]